MTGAGMFALLLALLSGPKEHLGPLVAGAKLGGDYVVTSVTTGIDAVHVRVRRAGGEVVTYGLAKASSEPSLIDIHGARIFYVGDPANTDGVERGAQLLIAALQKAELTGDKLATTIAEKLAAGPPKLDADTAAFILEALEGKWSVTLSKDGTTTKSTATTTRLGSNVLRQESALSPFSLIGFDQVSQAFWVIEIDPKTGGVTHVHGTWNADEQTLEFRQGPGPSGTVQMIVVTIVSPKKHVIEQFATERGRPYRLMKTATYER